ncbi:hypothetical protein ES705_11869 [subsurface metagenome]
MGAFERFAKLLSGWFNWVALIALVAMVTLVAVDIIGAQFFKFPVPGGVELVSFLGVVIVSFSITQTYVLHRHIQVDFVIMRLPEQAKRVLACISSLFSMALFALIIWRIFVYAYDLQMAGEVSLTLKVPFVPFVYGVGVACVPLFLLLVREFLISIIEVRRK